MKLYFIGPTFKASLNNWLVQGTQGEVVGPAIAGQFKGNGVAVKFPKNATSVDCFLSELSRDPPSLALPCVAEAGIGGVAPIRPTTCAS